MPQPATPRWDTS